MLPRLCSTGVACAVLLTSLGCAHTFPARYDLDALRADSAKWPGEALVHYLSRPNAEVAACDAANFQRTDSKLVEPFVEAFESGKTPPQLWSACAARLVTTLPPASRRELVDRMAKLVVPFVEQGDAGRLWAVVEVLTSRPRETSASLQTLRTQLPSGPPSLAPVLASLRELLELDAGTLNGQPLTEASVLTLEDEPLLRRIEARVADESLRVAARRRIIRLHIAQSQVREVRERAAQVEAAVLAQGRWIQPVASLPAPAQQKALVVPVDMRISQDIATQLVRPFLAGDDARGAPAIDLRPLVRFAVGWSEPLPLCDAPEVLAVNPCIDPAEVRLGTGFATLDAAGVLHVNPKWAMADALDLVRAGLGLVVPVKLGERVSQVLQVPLTAQAPGSYCVEGNPTERGPMVNAIVVPTAHGLLVDAVDERARRVQFVLPRNAVGFEFGSCGGRGLKGAPGQPGANGANGAAGTNAMCPSSPGGKGGDGANGYPGGPGGDGGPGGEGGQMHVELRCGNACDDERLVRTVFRSRGGLGGEGGPGGAGGHGGQGGQGGSSTSCTVNGRTQFLSSGSRGSNGSQGAQGAPGKRGAPGRDGVVEVVRR